MIPMIDWEERAEAAEAALADMRRALDEALQSLATGPAKDGYAYSVLRRALAAAGPGGRELSERGDESADPGLTGYDEMPGEGHHSPTRAPSPRSLSFRQTVEYVEGVLSRDPFDEGQRQHAAELLRRALAAAAGPAPEETT